MPIIVQYHLGDLGGCPDGLLNSFIRLNILIYDNMNSHLYFLGCFCKILIHRFVKRQHFNLA